MKTSVNIDVEVILLASKKLTLLTNPVKLKIVKMLDENGEMNVTQIYQKLKMGQPDTSSHLLKLNSYDILKKDKRGRTCIYSLNREFIEKVEKISEK